MSVALPRWYDFTPDGMTGAGIFRKTAGTDAGKAGHIMKRGSVRCSKPIVPVLVYTTPNA